jgi:hypothetical protein
MPENILVPPLTSSSPLGIINVLSLTPDDFIRQGESAATQWVNMNSQLKTCHSAIKSSKIK